MKDQEKMSAILKKIDFVMEKVECIVTSLCMAGMVVTVLVGIVLRFILKIPNAYGEEISRYLMIAVIFIGIAMAARERAHLGIDSLVNALPPKGGKALRVFTDILSCFLYGFLTVESYRFCSLAMQYNQKSPSMTFLPMYLVYGLLLVGFILSTITAVLVILNDHVCRRPFLNLENEDSETSTEIKEG